MTTYDILLKDFSNVMQWVTSQPNFISVAQGLDKVTMQMNHTTDAEKKAFLLELMKHVQLVDIDGVKISMFDYLSRLSGDHLFWSVINQQVKTNIGTTYVSVFPSFYDSMPIGIDTTGYSQIGIQLLWNKNSGSSRHDARLVNHATPTSVMIDTEGTPSGLVSGMNDFLSTPTTIPIGFQNFRGYLRLQAKAGNATDDPIFDGIFIYLIR